MKRGELSSQEYLQKAQDRMTPEWKLVFRLSRSTFHERSVSEIREMAQLPLQWDKVFSISNAHRVFPLVFKNITDYCLDIVPSELFSHQKKQMMNVCANNLYMSSLLVKCLDLLYESGIPAVPFKGPSLARVLYGDVYFRSFEDLDLLIHPNDLSSAVRLLEENGFSAAFALSNAQLKKIVRTEKEYPLIHDETGFSLDLQWELTGGYFHYAMTLENLLPECRLFSFEGREIKVFGNEDLFVYLCIHGNTHIWQQLDHVCCVAELINGETEINWDQIFSKAQALGCERIIKIGTLLAGRLLSARVPSRITDSCTGDNRAADLAQKIVEMYYTEEQSAPVEGVISRRFSAYHLASLDSIVASIRFGIRLVFYPTRHDWKVFPFPASCSFVLYAIRPLRLIWEFMAGMVVNRISLL